MGQILGKASIREEVKPFSNLPTSAVQRIRVVCEEVTESSFAISSEELRQILHISLHEYLRLSESGINECSDAIFKLFASPDNATSPSDSSLIDSFQFLSTLFLISGMQLDVKVQYIFNLFDFNEASELSINEATLCLRQLYQGASKISTTTHHDTTSANVDVLDKLVMEAFDLHQVPESLKSHALIVEDCNKLDKAEFVNYIFSCAETLAFLIHFDDLLVQSTSVSCKEDLTVKPLRFCIPQTDDKNKSDQPWRDQLRLLQRQKTNDEDTHSPPVDGLSLDWIYGRNAGAPVKYCSNGDVVYAAGSTLIKVTQKKDGEFKQEYFMSHSGLVSSIDTFKTNDGVDIVASADVGRDSKICIWSLATLSSIVTLTPSLHQSDGISKLCFSPSGELLLVMGNDKDNTLAIYKWREGKIIYSSKLPKLDIYDCSFLSSDNSFGVCTNEDVYFYTKLEVTNNHPSYNKQRGVFNRLSTREIMTSIACAGNTVITGSLSGRIWLWEGRVCLKLIASLQSGPITQLNSPQNSDRLCASTHGGTVHLFNDKLEPIHKLSPNKGLDESARVIDTICCNSEQDRILIGQNDSLYQLSNEDDVEMITIGQSSMMDVSLGGNTIITIGSNNRVQVWDKSNHSILRECHIEDETLSCVAYNQHRDQLAIGYGSRDGTSRSSTDKSFVVLNGSDLEIVHQGSNSLEALTVCSYSNDGKLLAFGSEDACISCMILLRSLF